MNYIIGGSFEAQDSDPLVFINDLNGSVTTYAFPDSHDTDTSALYAQLKYQADPDTIYIAGIRGEEGLRERPDLSAMARAAAPITGPRALPQA